MTDCNVCEGRMGQACHADVERTRCMAIVELAGEHITGLSAGNDHHERDSVMRTARLAIENGTAPSDVVW